MAISFSKYVNITSGVGGNSGVRRRDLIGRIFSDNPLIPTGSMIEFTSLDDVLAYFGSTSEEYKRAAFYFGWISKNITRAKKIAFARWVKVASAPRIYGVVKAQALASWTSITAGSFGLSLGGVANTISGLNFSAATSLADVASIIQTAIRAKTGVQWTSATVSYNATSGRFEFVGGSAVAAAVAVTAGAGGSDIAGQLGWLTGAIVSDGALAETVTDTISKSAQASDNFGSFLFIPALTLDQVTEAAVWNDAQNNKFMFCVPVAAADVTAYSSALMSYSGVAVTLSGPSGEYHEMIPMIILAATDYYKRASVQNFMFQQFGVTPTVVNTVEANAYDALRANYYGRTQTAGQFLDFYQRGVLMGLSTDAVDQNTYANEMWLKDAAGSQIMELLLSVSRVSANNTGKAQLQSILQSVIDAALHNGTISVGKALNQTQKLYIAEMTGDDLAWCQVESLGYWMGVTFETFVTTDGRTEYKAVYTLIYSKDDAIRMVDGKHVMI